MTVSLSLVKTSFLYQNRIILLFVLLFSYFQPELKSQSLVVLGNLQDGGSPHIGCARECCKIKSNEKKVVALGLIDSSSEKSWLIEATPDISSQLEILKSLNKSDHPSGVNGIFLTHAHIGHYSGLMFLGKEALGANEIPVFGLSRMTSFLKNNGPWSQLVTQKNITLNTLEPDKIFELSKNLKITPIKVPHRDEFSETVGYLIQGPSKKVLFIPDIDKWEKWNRDISQLITQVDVALLDGTFYSNAEIGYRDPSAIPHPLVSESMEKFRNLKPSEKNKIVFIHLNHTNPLLDSESIESKKLRDAGFRIAEFGMRIEL